MPVFRLTGDIVFPSPELADDDGLLAVGGDLSTERLLLAYSMGIFPWYADGSPVLWWSPDPRLVLLPQELKVSRSLRRTIERGMYNVTFDTVFDKVIANCADAPRKDGEGTWITDEMREAYCRLHEAGFAHSVESWYEGELVGGLYGVALGAVFFGESMFSRMNDASKVAFAELVRQLMGWGFCVVDCQVRTDHLLSMGAREIPRRQFVEIIKKSLEAGVAWGKVCEDKRYVVPSLISAKRTRGRR